MKQQQIIKTRFYKTSAWEKMRESVLRSAGYMDELEKRHGRTKEADTVHHIFPRELYPQYALERWNLIALSKETHETLHNRIDGKLTRLGQELMRETAEKNNIDLKRLIVVCGAPGSGKTTYVKRHLGNAIAYDADYIAGAFRLKGPHEEINEPAIKMALSMRMAFAESALERCGTVYIIWADPSVDLFAEARPDQLVICSGTHDISRRRDYLRISEARLKEIQEKIQELRGYCEANGIDVVEA